MLSQLQSSYGMVLNGDLLHEIAAHSRFVEVKKGHIVMDVGDSILGLPMLMDGAIKILRVDDEGDEMLLDMPASNHTPISEHFLERP